MQETKITLRNIKGAVAYPHLQRIFNPSDLARAVR